MSLQGEKVHDKILFVVSLRPAVRTAKGTFLVFQVSKCPTFITHRTTKRILKLCIVSERITT